MEARSEAELPRDSIAFGVGDTDDHLIPLLDRLVFTPQVGIDSDQGESADKFAAPAELACGRDVGPLRMTSREGNGCVL